MLKSTLFTLFILLSGVVLKAQEGSITGKVTDGSTGKTIAFASVFLSNATKSAPTNANGEFTLTGIQPGQYDVVVSYVGYKTYSQKVLVSQAQIKLDIKLNVQTINLKSVSIKPKKTDRVGDLKRFTDAFIGTSDNARKCTIVNPEIIDIDYDTDTRTLEASTTEMLKIENRALGYRLNILLTNLKVNYTTSAVNYNGKLFFEELKGEPDEVKLWKANRMKTYTGSLRHFYRSLYQNATTENGFEIHHAASHINTAKKPEELITRKLNELAVKGANADRDSVRYWKVQQSLAPYLYNVNKSITPGDSVMEYNMTPGLYNLKFNNHLYLVSKNKQTIRSNLGSFYTWTILKLNKNMAQFDHNGILTNDADVTYEGTHLEKIADQLPYDFVPDNEPKSKILTQVKDTKPKLFFEKIYLHTDRELYTQGDTIWYKAYLVNAQNSQPIGISGNLYVELIQQDPAQIVNREILRMEQGTGNGDFTLLDSIPSGKYTLRAYTNWSRNFGDNFVFEKELTVLNTAITKTDAVFKPESPVSKTSAQLNSTFQAAVKAPVVRFYPESGSLIEGVSSIVAVKAEDKNGKGTAAKGSVINSEGDTIARFNCDTLGFGMFAMLPTSGQVYHAGISRQNKNISVDLPAILTKGLSLRVMQTDSLVSVIVGCNDATLADIKDRKFTLAGKHAGKPCFIKNIQITENQTLIKISNNVFPEGITAITLADDQSKPQCERLVYVHQNTNTTGIVIQTDKSAYHPKEKTTVHIKTGSDNANLSMAVVDADVVPVQAENITSYLMLRSELKGEIETPNRYFDTTNINRKKQLDLLLMTQGWRDFVWRRLADTAIRISYKAEDGFDVSGRVRQKFGNKSIKDVNITLTAFKAKGQKIFTARTDTGGRYAINNLQLYGPQDVKLTARNDKGVRSGWLLMDSVNNQPLPVYAKPIVEIDTTSAIVKAINQRGFDRTKNSMKNGIKLKEVKIKEKKRIFLQSGAVGTEFGYPDLVYKITKEDQVFPTLAKWLEYTIPGIRETPEGDAVKLSGPGGGPSMSAMIVDGREIGPEGLGLDEGVAIMRQPYYNLGMDKFKTVLYRHLVGMSQDGGIINIFVLYLTLVPNALVNKDFGAEIAGVNGYYQARTFYKPLYDTTKDLGKADWRTTIHWEPNIITDANGEATVSFYNADPKTKVRVVVEGVSTTGGPVNASYIYTVKP
ncbi:carboxypeptidase regulatory-like domain-containing protein [Mucilaginibacter sp. HMF5004]|uniref:carboxypeptidase regulatory-like domain-containing protein n=1 Tax=Mucilaginibacter rivuli TaxID=2857527 RepID=UPI001C5D2105|nr:carboxypeptidase regulatory-like domain-containing protein [Mucilaginibacter rivuli]MBW4891902.1 carboxypeptidase regulatory-like domain-containing protein [Mucilaginibacter rivuli]